MAHKINDNGTDREMTNLEENAYLKWLEDIKTEEKAKAEALKIKNDARNLILAKLGITAEEAAALLG